MGTISREAHAFWTVTRRRKFLQRLREDCDLRAACAAVGATVKSARELKANNADFAAGWAAAYAAGREWLDEELVGQALRPLASDAPGGALDAELAFRVLRNGVAKSAPVTGARPGARSTALTAAVAARVQQRGARRGEA